MALVLNLPGELRNMIYDNFEEDTSNNSHGQDPNMCRLSHESKKEYESRMLWLVENRIRNTRARLSNQLLFRINDPFNFSDLGTLKMSVTCTAATPGAKAFGMLVDSLVTRPLPHVHTLLIELVPPETIRVGTQASTDREAQHIAALCMKVHERFRDNQDIRIILKLLRTHQVLTLYNGSVLNEVLHDRHESWRVAMIWSKSIGGLWAREAGCRAERVDLQSAGDGIGMEGELLWCKRQ